MFFFLYGGFVTITSIELLSNLSDILLMSIFIISNLSSKLFSCTLLSAIFATSSCISTPYIFLSLAFLHNSRPIIPVPVPISTTIASFFMFFA